MEKLQLLFPEPMLKKLRDLAKDEDRPVSELIRRAVERYLSQVPIQATPKGKRKKFPTYDCGGVIAPPEKLRELSYE